MTVVTMFIYSLNQCCHALMLTISTLGSLSADHIAIAPYHSEGISEAVLQPSHKPDQSVNVSSAAPHTPFVNNQSQATTEKIAESFPPLDTHVVPPSLLLPPEHFKKQFFTQHLRKSQNLTPLSETEQKSSSAVSGSRDESPLRLRVSLPTAHGAQLTWLTSAAVRSQLTDCWLHYGPLTEAVHVQTQLRASQPQINLQKLSFVTTYYAFISCRRAGKPYPSNTVHFTPREYKFFALTVLITLHCFSDEVQFSVWGDLKLKTV